MLFTIGSLLGGLGLFFVGLKLLTEHLKMLGGRRLRERIVTWTKNPLLGLLWGGFFITITQSTAATTFILIGMLRSGMMAVRQVLPIIIGMNMWAGIGVLILAFDVRSAFLLLLGVAGLTYTSDRLRRVVPIAGAAFGLGLLFLGLCTMQSGVAPLADTPWFKGYLQASHGSYVAGFLIAAALSLAVQSSMAVTVVAIACERAGLFTLNEAIMIVYGANVGSSFLTLVLSSSLSGHSKQIAMYQTAYNFVGALVLVPAFYAEIYGGIPCMKYVAERISQDGGTQIAIVFILFNIVPGLTLLPLRRQAIAFLEYLWPETIEEQVSRPKYIHKYATEDPDSALDLIKLEQTRLIELLTKSMDSIRQGVGKKRLPALQEAFKTLSKTIQDTISELSGSRHLSAEIYDRLNLLLDLQHSLQEANDEVGALGDEFETLRQSSYGHRFARTAVEGIDVIALTLLDVARQASLEDVEFLSTMTTDDGKGLATVRSAYLAEECELDSTARMKLLTACNRCERLIRHFGEMGRTYMSLNLA